jgi:two-component system cell cycle response regulator
MHSQDGLYAVSVARKERPDLVLLDLGLPGGDGLTVLERYRNLSDLCSIPVVVLTGRDPRVAEAPARAFDIAGFLRKPVDNAVLLATIQEALEGRVDASSPAG